MKRRRIKAEVSYRESKWKIYSTGSDSGASAPGAETFMLLSTAIISARMSRMGYSMSVHK